MKLPVLHPDLFAVLDDDERARAAFKRSVRAIEIEVSTYCNRTCWFCPNETIDRRSKKTFMDLGLYRSILEELGAIAYDGMISYSGYTEATSDRSFLDRLREARDLVPNSYRFTCSNGDYLTPDYLEALADAGMNEMFVSCYVDDKERGTFSLAEGFTAINRLSHRLRRPVKVTHVDATTILATMPHDRMVLTISSKDHAHHANDRAGLVRGRRYARTEPCSWLYTNVYVDHDGTVVPCCNIRSDAPGHDAHAYGRIAAGRELFGVWAGAVAVGWRRALSSFGPKEGPCATCNQATITRKPNTEDFLDELERLGRGEASSCTGDAAAPILQRAAG